MPDIDMNVNTSVVIPVNVFPLIDDVDFKTIKSNIVYNSAGLVVRWHFVTIAGVVTTTVITPTTAGVYDWSQPTAGTGVYAIEIPASGGASVNNNSIGCGWITGVATGVLPWRGPIIGFGMISVVAGAIWDETSTGHIDAGKAGEQLWTDINDILTDTAVIGIAGAGLTSVAIGADGITTASIQDGAITTAKEYIIAGTVNATSTTLKVYTALAITGERKYNNMCLYSASNGERSRIMSTGNGYFNVRGFGSAPANATVLRVYADGCL